jgi:hypothetical protein
MGTSPTFGCTVSTRYSGTPLRECADGACSLQHRRGPHYPAALHSTVRNTGFEGRPPQRSSFTLPATRGPSLLHAAHVSQTVRWPPPRQDRGNTCCTYPFAADRGLELPFRKCSLTAPPHKRARIKTQSTDTDHRQCRASSARRAAPSHRRLPSGGRGASHVRRPFVHSPRLRPRRKSGASRRCRCCRPAWTSSRLTLFTRSAWRRRRASGDGPFRHCRRGRRTANAPARRQLAAQIDETRYAHNAERGTGAWRRSAC